MNPDVSIPELEQHHFVSGLSPKHVQTLARLAGRTRFAKGDVIFREGEHCSEFYLIVSGPVALELTLPRGVLQVQRLGTGDGLGWSAALVGRGKHFQARALDDVDAFVFEGPDVLAECQKDPEFGFAFMVRMLDVVSKRLQATRLQLADMYSPVAKQAGV
jgi:CRP/FNR family cyclic AMP-dependent transcriptional regulator